MQELNVYEINMVAGGTKQLDIHDIMGTIGGIVLGYNLSNRALYRFYENSFDYYDHPWTVIPIVIGHVAGGYVGYSIAQLFKGAE